ncbi:hypothetical protein GBA52_004574 [Prunus armeniaca]|nr:hypothetical protein GBA52_004574 [Prunus armeniaca]
MGERRIGVAVDFSAGSRAALKWTVDNVARQGDFLILVVVPLIPVVEFSDANVMKKYKVNPDPETLDIASTAAKQKEITVVMKIYWGDAREKIIEAIDKVPLSLLVIGNRGLGKLKRVIMGSVSNFVVNNASCPVTVVKNNADQES